MTAADAGPDADRFILQASFGQRRLWFLHELDPASSAAYVDHGALRLRGDLDLAAAQRAIDTLVARHETLRTCLGTQDGDPVQVVWSRLRVPLETVGLDGRDLAGRGTRGRGAPVRADGAAAVPGDGHRARAARARARGRLPPQRL